MENLKSLSCCCTLLMHILQNCFGEKNVQAVPISQKLSKERAPKGIFTEHSIDTALPGNKPKMIIKNINFLYCPDMIWSAHNSTPINGIAFQTASDYIYRMISPFCQLCIYYLLSNQHVKAMNQIESWDTLVMRPENLHNWVLPPQTPTPACAPICLYIATGYQVCSTMQNHTMQYYSVYNQSCFNCPTQSYQSILLQMILQNMLLVYTYTAALL